MTKLERSGLLPSLYPTGTHDESIDRSPSTWSCRNPVVDAWFENYDNPQKDLVQAVRGLILDTDPRITEVIKWQAPTFVYKGNLPSFYPRSSKHVSLMFHTGASLSDPSGVLEGDGDTSRVLRILNHDDLGGKADALSGLIASWIALKG